jgi:hypothetical protein
MYKNSEELDKKLIDNLERMARNVGGEVKRWVENGQYSYAIRGVENLIADATMALYVMRMKVKGHGSNTASAEDTVFGKDVEWCFDCNRPQENCVCGLAEKGIEK